MKNPREQSVRGFQATVEGRNLDKVGFYLNGTTYMMNIPTAMAMSHVLSTAVHESKDDQLRHLKRRQKK